LNYFKRKITCLNLNT